MDYKELIEWLRRVVEHGDETPQEYCTNRCGGCEVCDQAADAMEILLAERDAIIGASRGNCNFCVHADRGITIEPCISCAYGLGMYDCWQWRGPREAVPESDTK